MGQSRASYFQEYRAKRAIREADGGLLAVSTSAFVSRRCVVRPAPPYTSRLLSVPRGNGKSVVVRVSW